jgi:hypothetical protein
MTAPNEISFVIKRIKNAFLLEIVGTGLTNEPHYFTSAHAVSKFVRDALSPGEAKTRKKKETEVHATN